MIQRRTWCIAVVLFWSAAHPDVLVAQSLIPGTFEQGQEGPLGWRRRAEGVWSEGGAHEGKRCLRGRSSRGEVAWESQTVAIEQATDYRLEGWLRCASGEAVLSLELLDEKGQALGRAAAPALRQIGAWRYVAVEHASGPAVAARVLFWVKGEADLDDVALTGVATSYMGNKSVETDERGRIGFWSEEKSSTLVPGRYAGQGRPDATVLHSGKNSLELTATSDWYAWSSVAYPQAAWTDRVRLSSWARCDGQAKAQLLACWVDDMQQVLRVDRTEPSNNADWRQLVLLPSEPPAAATAIRVVAVARGGRVWFDDFELERLRPNRRNVQVFVNQVGYDQDGPKTAVVATNFFPSGETTIAFQLLTPEWRVASARAQVTCAGRIYSGKPDDWGWYFWRADFTSCRDPGTYRAAALVTGESSSSSMRSASTAFKIRRGVVLAETAKSAVDFFFIQRCGFDVPGWHKACHLDDAKLPDGKHVDVTGGWHSAGDYNKLVYEHGDGGVVFALLAAHRASPSVFENQDRDHDGLPDVLDEACWGADFMTKMQIPESGGPRNHVHQGPGRNWTKWSAPDVHTDNIIGTADDPVITSGEGNSPLLIGAWARLPVLLVGRNIKKDYLRCAERLWDHATKRGTQVLSPHLLLSALELHRATGQAVYLESARRAVEALLSQQATSGRMRGAFGSYGAITAAALTQFALDHPKADCAAKIRESLKDYISFCVSTADNPFGFCRQPVQEVDYFFAPSMTLGNNFEVLARAWAAALIHRLTGDPRALGLAVDQLDWILGKNPEGLCMFEGKGARNPPRYHHRYNMIPGQERGAVPGCIPNGFVRDMGLADRPGFDLSRGGNRAPSFRTSEPWLVHNLYYLLAAAALDQATAPGGRGKAP